MGLQCRCDLLPREGTAAFQRIPPASDIPLRKVPLGGVDKFEPVSGCGEMDHAEEADCQLIVAGGNGAVDLEMAEHPFNAIALLVERSIMLDLHAAV